MPRKDEGHHTIGKCSEEIHKLLSYLVPSKGRQKYGGRLRGLSYLVSKGKLNSWNHDQLMEFSNETMIKSRPGKKKYLDQLEKCGLIERENDIWYPTEKAVRLWNGLLDLVNKLEPSERPLILKSDAFYEHIYTNVHTNGRENATWTWNFCLNGFKGLELPWSVESGHPLPKGDFKLYHSDNIESYETLIDDETLKKFVLKFKKFARMNDVRDYWFQYDWPKTFLFSWEKWNVRFIFKDFPVKHLSAIINLPDGITAYDLTLNFTEPTSETRYIGRAVVHDPFIIPTGKRSQIIWHLSNVPTHVRYQLSWKWKRI